MAPLSAVAWLFLGLGTAGERDPWTASLGQLADRSLELALGAYPDDSADFWPPPKFWDAEDLAVEIGDLPCVWTDGSLEPCPTAGISVAGAGEIFLPLSWRCLVLGGGEVEEYGDAGLDSCLPFLPVPAHFRRCRAPSFGALS